MKKTQTKVKSKSKSQLLPETLVPAEPLQAFFSEWKQSKESKKVDLAAVLKTQLKEKGLSSSLSAYLQPKTLFIPLTLEKTLLSWFKKQNGKAFSKYSQSYSLHKKEIEKKLKADFQEKVTALYENSGMATRAWATWLQAKLAAQKVQVSQTEVAGWVKSKPKKVEAAIFEALQQIPVTKSKESKGVAKAQSKNNEKQAAAAAKEAEKAALDLELSMQLESFAKQGRPSIKKKVMEAFQKLTQASSKEKDDLQQAYLTAREELIKKRWSQKFGKKSSKSNSRTKSVSELIEEIDLQDSLVDEGGSAEDVEVAYDVGGSLDRLVS